MSINWSRFTEIVGGHRRFLLTSHIRPDCDALGSELGMAGVLESLGKEVLIVNGQATPRNMKFLDPAGRIKTIGVDVQLGDLEGCEVLIVLDTSAWAQLGPMADVVRATRAKKLVVDHHVGSDDLGAEQFKDTRSEATGRLVFQAAEQLGVRLTPQIATPLFAALATDTGWFRFASTSDETYRIAGKLVEAGAKPHEIYNALYEQDTLARLNLIGRALARAATDLDGRLIHTSIRQEDFAATGAVASDTEEIINMTLTVVGTEVAAIFVELAAGGVKVSLRSRKGLDCSRLAEQFGGGGHKAAAGATLHEPLAVAQSKVLDAVRAAMNTSEGRGARGEG
jgi:bifunctional oligoribonuclease and PAP phosphatase NrnA